MQDPVNDKISIIVARCFIIFTGVLLGIPVVRNLHKRPWEEILFWVGLALYFVAAAFGILFNMFYPDYPDTDWRACCPFSYHSEDIIG